MDKRSKQKRMQDLSLRFYSWVKVTILQIPRAKAQLGDLRECSLDNIKNLV